MVLFHPDSSRETLQRVQQHQWSYATSGILGLLQPWLSPTSGGRGGMEGAWGFGFFNKICVSACGEMQPRIFHNDIIFLQIWKQKESISNVITISGWSIFIFNGAPYWQTLKQKHARLQTSYNSLFCSIISFVPFGLKQTWYTFHHVWLRIVVMLVHVRRSNRSSLCSWLYFSDAFVNMHMSVFCQTKSEGWTDVKTKTTHQHHHSITHSEKSPGSSGRDHFDTNFGTLCTISSSASCDDMLAG